MAIHIVSVWWIAVALLLCSPQVHSRNFTHDDIRDAIVTLVHMVRGSEDKLERHEYREKALGDQVKRMLVGLDKKHRALEPLKGMISRLDERLSNVETILLQKEEREKATQKKTTEVLDGIQKSLQSLSLKIAENVKQTKNAMEIDNNLTLNEESPLERRLEATDAKIDAVKFEIENLKHSLKKDTLRAVCLEMAYNVNPLEKHITEAEKLLNKYELKLSEYNGTAYKTDVIPLNEVSLADEAWHSKMTEVMEHQEGEIKKIQKLLSEAESMWKELPKRIELQTATNETLKTVAKITGKLKETVEEPISKIEVKLREMGDRFVTTNVDIQRSLTDGNTLTERAYNDISRSYEGLRTEIQTLKKGEDVMIQTADNVIATKKRIDYGVQQILMEVSELIKIQARSMNRTVNDRFDNIETTLMSSQTNTLTNLTTKIESEVSQVWRQIGIMHQQLITTKISLDTLANGTQQYVNSSTTTMKKVKDEVGDISTRMIELADNLNYALGKLSLTTQEFGQMSTGLVDVINSLKGDAKNVEVKVKEPSPGPRNVTAVAEKTP